MSLVNAIPIIDQMLQLEGKTSVIQDNPTVLIRGGNKSAKSALKGVWPLNKTPFGKTPSA